MSILTYTKFLESNQSDLINKYFLLKSNLPPEEIEDEFLRLKEVFLIDFSLIAIDNNIECVKNFNYFISLKKFNLSNENQIEEISRIQKHVNLVPLEIWFKKEFLDKIKQTFNWNSTYYTIDNKIIFFMKNGNFNVNSNVWNILHHNFNMYYSDTARFIRKQIREEFEITNVSVQKGIPGLTLLQDELNKINS